jgi:hypothetical protein
VFPFKTRMYVTGHFCKDKEEKKIKNVALGY